MSFLRRTPFAGRLLIAAAALLSPPAFPQTPPPARDDRGVTRAPASAPASRPARVETVADTLLDLREIEVKGQEARRRAFQQAIAFAIAVGRADEAAVRDAIDATGYQLLPDGEDLPDDPGRPLEAKTLGEWTGRQSPVDVETLPRPALRFADRDEMRLLFPAASRWMKPKDFALLLEPQPGQPRWVQRRGFVIVRERNARIYVVGGNLLEAFERRADEDPRRGP